MGGGRPLFQSPQQVGSIRLGRCKVATRNRHPFLGLINVRATMKDHFISPKLRLKRAKEQISSLEKVIEKYIKKHPYQRVVAFDKSEDLEIHKIVLTKAFPEKATILAVEAIEALRAALDQTVYATAVIAGKDNSKYASFPISETEQELENVIKGRAKDVPEPIIQICRAAKPFKEGNSSIWLLHQLSNQNKHRLVVPVGTCNAGMQMKNFSLTGTGSLLVPKWDPDNNEMVFAKIAPGTKLEYEVQFGLYAGFHGEGDFSGHPAAAALKSIEVEVRKICNEIMSQ